MTSLSILRLMWWVFHDSTQFILIFQVFLFAPFYFFFRRYSNREVNLHEKQEGSKNFNCANHTWRLARLLHHWIKGIADHRFCFVNCKELFSFYSTTKRLGLIRSVAKQHDALNYWHDQHLKTCKGVPTDSTLLMKLLQTLKSLLWYTTL